MIELSKKINSSEIINNKVIIKEGSVTDIPFKNDKIDFVTAFETVQFWPDIKKAFSEINRVTNNSATFILINRYPKVGTKWWDMAKLKDDKAYMAMLQEAGFSDINIDLKYKEGWIIVEARK